MAGWASLLLAAAVAAQPSSEDVNAANNPLQPTLGVNFQDQYTHRFHDLGDADANAFLLRGVVPHKLFGQPQILRVTLPIVTSADVPPSGSRTDIGDFNLFDLFIMKRGSVQIGIGPQLTAPTAGRDETGTGKWQAGAAAVLIAPQKWGLLGGLLTWQHSFAGDDDRRTQNNMQLQPFIIYNLPQGWYVRSTATWSWDLQVHTHYIPIGLGAGKVWKLGTTTFNLFGEPQWTVTHHGEGAPKFQVFFGLNLQFPLGK